MVKLVMNKPVARWLVDEEAAERERERENKIARKNREEIIFCQLCTLIS
jgi:hypothetical protein